MYAALLLHRFSLVAEHPLPEGGGFATLSQVVALFTDRETVFAGWVHYIAFDLFVSRYIVMDAQEKGVPHLLVVACVPLTLLAGPMGFAG